MADYLKTLAPLITIDGLTDISPDSYTCLLHEDHRWVLPIIVYAQQIGDLPAPCDVIMFDAHDDGRIPDSIPVLAKARKAGLTVPVVIELCQNHLRELDDDWVKAGMELGLIRDIVIFGVEDQVGTEKLSEYKDHLGESHKIRLAKFPNRGALGFQRELSDLGKAFAHQDLWDLLGWVHDPERGFGFAPGRERVLLDFDLDTFMMVWRGHYFSWADKVFVKELLEESHYITTKGWTGQKFIQGLIDKAGLITIARETEMCNGEGVIMDEILERLNRYVFDSRLNIKD